MIGGITTKHDSSLIKDLMELQRMAAVRNMRIMVIVTERVKGKDKTIIDQPIQTIGIECLPSDLFFKTNL